MGITLLVFILVTFSSISRHSWHIRECLLKTLHSESPNGSSLQVFTTLQKYLTPKYSSVISQLQTEYPSNQDKLVAPNTTKDALPRLDVS